MRRLAWSSVNTSENAHTRRVHVVHPVSLESLRALHGLVAVYRTSHVDRTVYYFASCAWYGVRTAQGHA